MLRCKKAFTLVELLATIAIMAVLIAVSIPYIADYVSWGRETADRQTLEVLNDAINRYKMQGGSLTALTAGKPYSNLLTTLKTPVSWNGLTHQFLRGSGAYEQATTIAATGSGRNYRLTGIDSYDAGGGNLSPLVPPPSFGGELSRYNLTFASRSQYTITVPQNVSAGNRLVLTHLNNSTISDIIGSVSDSRGNTWTVDMEQHTVSNRNLNLMSCRVTTPLQTGDAITVQLAATMSIGGIGSLMLINNSSAVNAAYKNNGYSANLSVTGSISEAPALIIGLTYSNNKTITSSWTQVGSIFNISALNYYVFYTVINTSGSVTFAGTLSPSGDTWQGIWAAYN